MGVNTVNYNPTLAQIMPTLVGAFEVKPEQVLALVEHGVRTLPIVTTTCPCGRDWADQLELASVSRAMGDSRYGYEAYCPSNYIYVEGGMCKEPLTHEAPETAADYGYDEEATFERIVTRATGTNAAMKRERKPSQNRHKARR